MWEDSTEEVAGGNQPSPSRRLDESVLAPGARVTVTVATELAAGRTVLREVFPGEELTVEAVDPEPAQVAAANGSIYVAWDLSEPANATISYTGRAPSDGDGETIEWAGTLVGPDGGTVVGGARSITVVSNFVERVLARDEIREQDIATAADAFSDGRISEEAYRQIIERWRAVAPDPEPDDSPSSESTSTPDSDSSTFGGLAWWRK